MTDHTDTSAATEAAMLEADRLISLLGEALGELPPNGRLADGERGSAQVCWIDAEACLTRGQPMHAITRARRGLSYLRVDPPICGNCDADWPCGCGDPDPLDARTGEPIRDLREPPEVHAEDAARTAAGDQHEEPIDEQRRRNV